jgi:hypothetical protein
MPFCLYYHFKLQMDASGRIPSRCKKIVVNDQKPLAIKLGHDLLLDLPSWLAAERKCYQ